MVPALVAAQSRSAVFIGRVLERVLTDTSRKPLANAEILLPELSLRVLTGDNGEFMLAGIIPGTHQVIVRRIGYGQLDTRLEFAENQTVDRTVYLSRITSLDSMLVAGAKPRDPMMLEFEENRARGVGHFITRAELEKQESRPLGAIMSRMPGLALVHGVDGEEWVLSRRSPMTRCGRNVQCLRSENLYYIPRDFEARQGMKQACYASVYLDRLLMNPFHDPFDLNSISAAHIEGIEWYADRAQTPPQYSGPRAPCGTVVIHTRRS